MGGLRRYAGGFRRSNSCTGWTYSVPESRVPLLYFPAHPKSFCQKAQAVLPFSIRLSFQQKIFNLQAQKFVRFQRQRIPVQDHHIGYFPRLEGAALLFIKGGPGRIAGEQW